jgi:hypothetical protein
MQCTSDCCSSRSSLHGHRPAALHNEGTTCSIDSERFRQQDLKAELDDLMAASRLPPPSKHDWDCHIGGDRVLRHGAGGSVLIDWKEPVQQVNVHRTQQVSMWTAGLKSSVGSTAKRGSSEAQQLAGLTAANQAAQQRITAKVQAAVQSGSGRMRTPIRTWPPCLSAHTVLQRRPLVCSSRS